MSLDLDDVLGEWDCADGELAARLVPCGDAVLFLQLRVDLGLLQMQLDDRPDGTRYHGHASVTTYIGHELRAGRRLADADWQELSREIAQLNFRRLGLAYVAEAALRDQQDTAAAEHLQRALRDIETCLLGIQLLEQHKGHAGEQARLKPTLFFNRARLGAQRHVALREYESAIEAADRGFHDLDALLAAEGYEPEQRSEDPGIVYLRELGARLRQEYDLPLTLRERLEAAIAADDFEAAAAIHAELRRRGQSGAE